MEYDEIHHNDPVQVTDEISITYFPNTLTASARASDLVYSGKVDYHGYDVGKFTVGGKVAFCIQHNKYNPKSGTGYTLQDWNNETARRILYFGYKGIQPWSKFENDVHARVLTSLALSYLVQGRFPTDDYVWDTGKLKEFLDYCKSHPLPDTKISFDKTSVNAYVRDGIQVTDWITFKGNKNNSISIQVPKNVTLHYSNGSSVTNNKAVVKGGQKFYLSAPLTHTGRWNTGKLTGSLKTVTQLKKIVPKGNYQSLAQAAFGVSGKDKVNLTCKLVITGKSTSAKKECESGTYKQ